MQADIGGAYKTQTNTLPSCHYRAGSHRRAGGKGVNATAGKPTDAPTEVAQIKSANPIFSMTLGLPEKPRRVRFLADVAPSCEALGISREEALRLGEAVAKELVKGSTSVVDLLAVFNLMGSIGVAMGSIGREVGLENARHYGVIGFCYMKHFFPSMKSEAAVLERALLEEISKARRAT